MIYQFSETLVIQTSSKSRSLLTNHFILLLNWCRQKCNRALPLHQHAHKMREGNFHLSYGSQASSLVPFHCHWTRILVRGWFLKLQTRRAKTFLGFWGTWLRLLVVVRASTHDIGPNSSSIATHEILAAWWLKEVAGAYWPHIQPFGWWSKAQRTWALASSSFDRQRWAACTVGSEGIFAPPTWKACFFEFFFQISIFFPSVLGTPKKNETLPTLPKCL